MAAGWGSRCPCLRHQACVCSTSRCGRSPPTRWTSGCAKSASPGITSSGYDMRAGICVSVCDCDCVSVYCYLLVLRLATSQSCLRSIPGPRNWSYMKSASMPVEILCQWLAITAMMLSVPGNPVDIALVSTQVDLLPCITGLSWTSGLRPRCSAFDCK